MLKKIFCVAIFAMSIFVLSCGKKEAIDPNKPFSGKTITVLYMSSVYADAARDIVEEFEEKTGATVNVVDFPYVTLHEKALLDLTSQTGSFDVISVASQWDGEYLHHI